VSQYVGVTNDLVRRIYEHREGAVPGFAKTHGLKQLVHFEKYDAPMLAIQREKNIKHWSRAWKPGHDALRVDGAKQGPALPPALSHLNACFAVRNRRVPFP
jgi:hypothetical protein